jgi:hypothetical protein
MAVAGLAYAISMVAVTPGTVGRFRDATAGSEVAENFIAVVWLDSAVGVVVALLVAALFVVLGLGLRQGRRVVWGITLGVCVLGVLGGCGSVVAIGGQQSGDAVAGSLGEALNTAYPSGWIGLNAAVAVAQVIAYLLVAFLLLLAPRAFFGAARAAGTPGAHGPGHPATAPAGGQAGWDPNAGWGTHTGWGPHPGQGANTGWGASPTPGTGAGNPGGPAGGFSPAGFGYASPPSESAVTTSPWAAPQSADQYSPSDQSSSDADQNFVHRPVQKRPEDEYWSRPSD